MIAIDLVVLIHEALEAAGDEEKGKKMAAYMKNKFAFHGVSAPDRTALLRPIWEEHKVVIKEHILLISEALWGHQHRECPMAALELMKKCKKQFTLNDLPIIEHFITTHSWWDTVDFIASTIVGHILQYAPEYTNETTQRYMDSSNMWLQRTALIFQLKYKEETDEKLLYSLIDQTKGSKEFFINKASGWALRQYSKYNPKSVANYITKNKAALSNLTIKEGSKYL